MTRIGNFHHGGAEGAFKVGGVFATLVSHSAFLQGIAAEGSRLVEQRRMVIRQGGLHWIGFGRPDGSELEKAECGERVSGIYSGSSRLGQRVDSP
jgi:hypothetical protein